MLPSAQVVWNHVVWKFGDSLTTTVDELEKSLVAGGHKVDRYFVVTSLKGFQKLKLGWFISGRRGHRSRITWQKKPKELSPIFDAPQTDKSSAVRMTEHEIPLRPGVSARLAIPFDITPVEAARLCEFVNFIPIQ